MAAARNALAAAMPYAGPWPTPTDLLGQVDAVVIAAPTRLHHALGMAFLRHGVHVLLEKPLAATADRGRRAGRGGPPRRRGPPGRSRRAIQPGLCRARRPAQPAVGLRSKYIEAVRCGPFSFRSTDVGVVLDLMIHDLDLVLSLVRSRVRRIDALGVSVLGGHEDVANVRLEFQNGCVASLNASRVSYDQARRMQVWSAAINGHHRLLRPHHHHDPSQRDAAPPPVQRREPLAGSRSSTTARRTSWRSTCRASTQQFPAVDALALELDDFVDSIRSHRPPRVSGEQGRDAVALAEEILLEIDRHVWDATTDGPVGPQFRPRLRTIPAPHFQIAPVPRKEAG